MSAPRRPRRWDESDVRIRPPRRGSRPRTKERPDHDDAVTGWVLAVDRGRYHCLLPPPATLVDRTPDGSGGLPPRHAGPSTGSVDVVAVRARELKPSDVVVGDVVDLVGEVSGTEDTLARIVRVRPRRTALRRTADDTDDTERVIVANADQVCVVVAAADPPPQPRLIDRALVAAWDAGAQPLLCVTKADLADPAPLITAYADVDLRAVAVTVTDGRGMAQLQAAVAGRVTVLVGSSGVGKSTLVNALTGAERRTGSVNTVTGRGRHTSVSARVLGVRGGGWVVDTPGLRSFGLAHISPERLLDAFDDLSPATQECPRGCDHDNPDCALGDFVAAGGAGPAGPQRLASFRRLLHALRQPA